MKRGAQCLRPFIAIHTCVATSASALQADVRSGDRPRFLAGDDFHVT